MPWWVDLTISGLSMVIIWKLFTKWIDADGKRTEAFTKTVEKLDDRHRDERREWKTEFFDQNSRTNAVIDDLRGVIRDRLSSEK